MPAIVARQDSAQAAAAGTGLGNGEVLSTIKDLMESVIDSSADVLWGAVSTWVVSVVGVLLIGVAAVQWITD